MSTNHCMNGVNAIPQKALYELLSNLAYIKYLGYCPKLIFLGDRSKIKTRDDCGMPGSGYTRFKLPQAEAYSTFAKKGQCYNGIPLNYTAQELCTFVTSHCLKSLAQFHWAICKMTAILFGHFDKWKWIWNRHKIYYMFDLFLVRFVYTLVMFIASVLPYITLDHDQLWSRWWLVP